jgi:hypothetical protein
MTVDRALTSQEIQEIGVALYGSAWRAEMAKGIGVPRQSIGYYLRSGGVSGAHAAAVIGLVARMAARELRTAREREVTVESRQADLAELLRRFDLA